MATFTPKKLAFIQLPAITGDVYDSGASIGEVHLIILHNTNTTPEIVTLYLDDGTNTFQIYKMELAANVTIQLSYINEGLIVDASSKLTGKTTTASKVTCYVSGSERT